MTAHSITIKGAGVLGLWQARQLLRAGHRVHLIDTSHVPFAAAASRYAGAMLAPDCEAEAAPAIIRDLGHEAIGLWKEACPAVKQNGSLVVAAARDGGERDRFAQMTDHHRTLDSKELAAIEPELAARFPTALYFAGEAHMDACAALNFLLDDIRTAGAEITFDADALDENMDQANHVIDCTGMGAANQLPDLRGVRGERLIVETDAVNLTRPVRLLHPRHPIYVVPWGKGRYMIGATVVESEDDGPASVRSVLELLGTAYALHTGFAEAGIIDIGAGVRPAFSDNIPRAIVRDGGHLILVNGAWRHGFLLAPILAEAVLGFVNGTNPDHPLLRIES